MLRGHKRKCDLILYSTNFHVEFSLSKNRGIMSRFYSRTLYILRGNTTLTDTGGLGIFLD